MSGFDLSGIHIIGAGGLGRDFVACFKQELKIAGFWDDKIPAGHLVGGFPVLGTLAELFSIPQQVSVIIAAGNPKVRKQVGDTLSITPHSLTTLTHSTARLFDAGDIKLDEGCVVFPGVHITTNVIVGRNTIIHSFCSLHHDTRIGSDCMVMPGVICAGNVEIGDEVYIGPGRAFIYGTKIKSGERCD